MPIMNLNAEGVEIVNSTQELLKEVIFHFKFTSEKTDYNIDINISEVIEVFLTEKTAKIFFEKEKNILGNLTFDKIGKKISLILRENKMKSSYEDFIKNNGFALEQAIKKESGHPEFSIEMDWL